MNDKNGTSVGVGDIVKVLEIYEGFLQMLPDDERLMHEAMLNNDYVIDAIVEGDTKASVSFEHKTPEGIYCSGLYMMPNEFELVKSNASPKNT